MQVEVFVRKRPLNAQEKKSKQFDVVTTVPSEDWGARCVVHEPKKKVRMNMTSTAPLDLNQDVPPYAL